MACFCDAPIWSTECCAPGDTTSKKAWLNRDNIPTYLNSGEFRGTRGTAPRKHGLCSWLVQAAGINSKLHLFRVPTSTAARSATCKTQFPCIDWAD
jgi:hypothetical protein